MKILRRQKHNFELRWEISITDQYLGVVGIYGHKMGENKMAKGECTEVNSEDEKCMSWKYYY